MKQANAQRELALLIQWASTLPPTYRWKTHVNVGAPPLMFNGTPLSPARQRSFGVWNSWADMRVWDGSTVWLTEGKLVATGGAYGQLFDYLDQYPQSEDYQQFGGAPVRGQVVCGAATARLISLFGRFNLRTIVYTPSWFGEALANKVFREVDVL